MTDEYNNETWLVHNEMYKYDSKICQYFILTN